MNHDNRHLYHRRFLNGYVYLVALILFSSLSFAASYTPIPPNTDAFKPKQAHKCFDNYEMKTGYVATLAGCVDYIQAVSGFTAISFSYEDCDGSDGEFGYPTCMWGNNNGSLVGIYEHRASVNMCGSDFPYERDGMCYKCKVDEFYDSETDSCTLTPPEPECEPGTIWSEESKACLDQRTCDDLAYDLQLAQYACNTENPNKLFYDSAFKWNCVDKADQVYPDIYTNCEYTIKECIVGINCEEEKDEPECLPSQNPNDPQCPLPPKDPNYGGSGGGGSNPVPTPNPSYCELNPTICQSDEKPTIEPNTNPDPESKPDVNDPDLSKESNVLNNTIEKSNLHLENINDNVRNLNDDLNNLLDKNNTLNKHQLGALNEISKKLDSSGKLEGTVDYRMSQMNQKLEDIKCLLDENCEADGKEKPTANVDCQASIFECKGDVIQCAMLKLQYENTCAADDLEKLEAAFAAHTGLDPAASIVQADEIDLSKIDSRYLDNGVSFGAAQCPAPLAIRHDFGFAGKLDTEFSFEPACEYARLINPLILVFAWLSGLYIIGRTQGVLS